MNHRKANPLKAQKENTMNFTLTFPKNRNFCASDLMYEYAKKTPGAKCRRDRYFTTLLSIAGIEYYYDHWSIEYNADDTITVTSYLKEFV